MLARTIFSPEHEQFRDSVRKFIAAEITPYYAQWEKDGQIDREVWRKAGAQGFLVPTAPEAYGGVEGDFLFGVVVSEELSKAGVGAGVAFGLHSDIVVPYIIHNGSEAQKEKYLPGCISGDIVTAVAMTEPDTGSDLQAITTTAVADGDDYVINGSKTFISNGQQADLIVVACKTGEGISLILVEGDTPGFERGKNLEKIGLKAQDTSELFFQDCRVPKANLLGMEGMGFILLMQQLPLERVVIAAGVMTTIETILGQTVEYVKERRAFGKPIAAFQNTQFELADLDAQTTAMRVFVDHCIALQKTGDLDNITASKAKMLVTELQNDLISRCLQLHGGNGYMWEYPVARAYADARIATIAGGTTEIMKLIIGRALLA